MNSVVQELHKFATHHTSRFRRHHTTQGVSAKFWQDLEAFAQSRMDAPRTSCSRRLAIEILTIIGYADLAAFRDVVLNREEGRRISYPGQRDHSAHTINNYLLGWYLWARTDIVQEALLRQFERRSVRAGRSFPFDSSDNFFGCIWQYASLMHDVGYMFEGALPLTDSGGRHDLTSIGTLAVRSYFESEMWRDYGVRSLGERRAFIRELGVDLSPPHFAGDMSLYEIADVLRDPGEVAQLADYVREDCERAGTTPPGNLARDTFAIWQAQYQAFGLDQMSRRTASLGRVFEALLKTGMAKAGRILDHGVCSGLLQFLLSTYYYRLQAAARSIKPKEQTVKSFAQCIWSPEFWWSGISWATAACAIHNVQVMDQATTLSGDWPGRLRIRDDPLAYLGVLVDVVQEWDRYPVLPSRERVPVQGHEVSLETVSGKAVLTFLGAEGKNRADKVKRELNRSLSSWQRVLAIKTG